MVSHLIERMAAHLSWWASNDFPAQRLPQPVHRIPPFHILKSSLSVLKQKGKEMKCVASMKRSTFTSTFHQDWCSQPIASSPTYFWFQGRTAKTNKNPDRWRNLQAFQRRKKEKAFLEGISGNAPECRAINFMLPLHNLLLPKRTEYLKQNCTKKYITIKKMNPAGWAGYQVIDPFS